MKLEKLSRQGFQVQSPAVSEAGKANESLVGRGEREFKEKVKNTLLLLTSLIVDNSRF